MTTQLSVSDQTYQYFVQEAADLLKTIERELQDLRQDFSLQKVHSLMRATHTLKGASASVGLETLQKTTHSLEDVFKALCYSDTVISAEMERLIFDGYDCLQLLLSSQLKGSQVDEADILDRMAGVVARLQDMLGDRFGQEGHLPTSSELGFDMTHSIFELGVTERINALSAALEVPNPSELRDLLQTHVEVFSGLGESLDLPGFEEIAKVTGQALQRHPDRVVEIAWAALENFRTAQMVVLGGDRTQGGSPSATLQAFCDPTHHVSADPVSIPVSIKYQSAEHLSDTALAVSRDREVTNQHRSQSHQRSWLKRRWQMLMDPLGTRSRELEAEATGGSEGDRSQSNGSDESANAETALVAHSTAEEPASAPTVDLEEIADLAVVELAGLTPTELKVLDVAPKTPLHNGPDAQNAEQLPEFRALLENEEHANPGVVPTDSSAAFESGDRNNSGETVRINVEHLDQLNQSMGELLMQQNRQMLYQDQLTTLTKRLLNRISLQQQQLNQQQDRHAIHQKYSVQPVLGSATQENSSLSSAYSQFDSLEFDQYSDIQLLLQSCLEETVQQSESAEAIELFLRQSRQSLEKQKRLLSNTRETLLAARMVPLETVFERFLPAVERLQTQRDKQVDVGTTGGDILVDKAIADNLYEPLLHLVRNAFDHGIESPEARLMKRKSMAGSISIEGVQQGRHLLISVRDDGKGLDLKRICHKAIENQLITQTEAAALTPDQIVDLLFEPGFSTVEETDTLSGRGVGLDVVQARLRSLQGWVTVSHEPGAGACFTLQVPANLTVANLLLCQAQGRTYALIADAIEHILIPTDKQVRAWKGGKMLSWQRDREEYLVPVNAIDEVLHYASPMSEHRRIAQEEQSKSTAHKPVILLHHQDMLVGLEVDQLLGEQELVISPLGQTVVPPAYLYGSSILPDGQLTLVLDGLMLAKIIVEQRQHNLAEGAKNSQSTPAPSNRDKPVFLKKLVLTVDDSITVRNTLADALQKANYQVIQARDGLEALKQLKRYPDVQAILCDIEMPGMNGFDFLKARQKLPKIASIPTIMLTSRTGDKHRVLTEKLGATAYITKPYLTPKLLEKVADAIETQTHSLVSTAHE